MNTRGLNISVIENVTGVSTERPLNLNSEIEGVVSRKRPIVSELDKKHRPKPI